MSVVDYDSVLIENEIITWDEVNSAESYDISIINDQGNFPST